MPSRSTHALRRYYKSNTGLFLRLSGGQSTRSLHRAVWGNEVSSRDEAFAYPYWLVLQTLRQVARSSGDVNSDPDEQSGGDPLRVLDLGCGVGGGVQYLLKQFDDSLRAMGVTLSPTQVERARRFSRGDGIDPARYAFLEADFHELPALQPIDVAYAIEALIHADRPEAFFKEVARVLRPQGRLVLVDDFLVDPDNRRGRPLSATEQTWVDTVQDGWHAHGLRSLSTAIDTAETHDLQLVQNHDLTPFLSLNRPRDRFIEWCIVPLRPLLWRWPYFRGLIGGDALQKCLNAGIIEYRHLVFEYKGTG